MKQRIYLLLTLFVSVWLSASAYDFMVEGIKYKTNSDGMSVTIISGGSKTTGSVVIPEKVTYEGKTYSVTSIGQGAFNGYSSLTNVIIPSTILSIGSGAFYNCHSLSNVTIPNSVSSVGDYVFHNCSSLASISIPNSITSIGAYAFDNCSSLTSVIIPNFVSSVGDGAFRNCSQLTRVEYNAANCSGPSSSSGAWFTGCTLKTLIIGDKVERIPDYLAYGQEKLSSIIIPSNVSSIQYNAFAGCSGLVRVEYNAINCAGPYSIVYAWFRDCPLTSLEIGDMVETIPDYLTYGQEKLSSIIIPSNVSSIQYNAFAGCSGLVRVEYNAINCAGPYSIDYAWFRDCPLTSLEIGDMVETIPDYLAYGQEKLSNINIPSSVTSIGKGAFAYCLGLTSITIPNSITSIGSSAFQNYTINEVNISCKDSDDFAKYVQRRDIYEIFHSSIWYGAVFNIYISDVKQKAIIIPNSVTSIGSYAFAYCLGLNNITIPNSVTSIGYEAFALCSGLTSITIPNSVTSIGSYAFSGCIYEA